MSRKVIYYNSSFSACSIEALNFIAIVESASGLTMDAHQKNIMCGFVSRLKGNYTTYSSDNWSKFVLNNTKIWPLCPINDTTANAAAYSAELISASIKGSYINMVPGDFSPYGVTGGTGKYFETYLNDYRWSISNFGFGIYSRTNAISNSYIDAGSNTSYLQTRADLSRFIVRVFGKGNGLTVANDNTDSRGLFQAQIGPGPGSLFTVEKMKNGLILNSDLDASPSQNSQTFTFHRRNTSYSIRELSMYILGTPFLTAKENADFYEAIQWYQTNIITGGRNV